MRARWADDSHTQIVVRLDAGETLGDQVGPVDLVVANDPLDPLNVALIEQAVTIEDPPQQARVRVSPTITKRQFYQAMAEQGEFTNAEALAAVRQGTMPARLATWISGRPANQQFRINMMFAGDTFRRHDPVVDAVFNSWGWTEDRVDDLWRQAAVL